MTGDITRSQTIRLRWPYVRRVLHKSCKAHGIAPEVVETLEASMETMFKSAFEPPSPDSLAGGLANTIAGRVCNYLTFTVAATLLTELAPLRCWQFARQHARYPNGEMNVALAGGIDISIDHSNWSVSLEPARFPVAT